MLSPEQNLYERTRVFWRRRGCMHPLASSETCSGEIIDSHVIQRKGPLANIVDDTNHVLSMRYSAKNLNCEIERIGWRKSSVFPGYCAGHDTSLFGDLERNVFDGKHEHCVLQAFRNLCNELYRKRAQIELFEFQRDQADQGCELDDQIRRQLEINNNIEGQRKTCGEMNALWEKFEFAISNNEFAIFKSKVYCFNGNMCINSSGAISAEFDFDGRKLADKWDLSDDMQLVSHSLLDTDQGGAVVFTWLDGEEAAEQVVSTFENIDDDKKGDIFVQYCFLNCDNTYFSKDWWDNLNRSQKLKLREYSRVFGYEGGAFVANEKRLVDWRFC